MHPGKQGIKPGNCESQPDINRTLPAKDQNTKAEEHGNNDADVQARDGKYVRCPRPREGFVKRVRYVASQAQQNSLSQRTLWFR